MCRRLRLGKMGFCFLIGSQGFLQLEAPFLTLCLFRFRLCNLSSYDIHHAADLVIVLLLYGCFLGTLAITMRLVQAILRQAQIGHRDKIDKLHARQVIESGDRERFHIIVSCRSVFTQRESNPAK